MNKRGSRFVVNGMFHQKGAPSKYLMIDGGTQPYMFGHGWRKFRKHRSELTRAAGGWL